MLDAAGKDVLFLETVGAGQSEVEVIAIADTVVLVLMPGSGDSIQALKANHGDSRRDRDQQVRSTAAKTMLNEVRAILSLDHERAWKVPIVLTEANSGVRVPELWEQIEAIGPSSRRGRARGAPAPEPRRGGVRQRPKTHLEHAVADDPELRRLLDEVQSRQLDPLTAVREIMHKVFKVGDGDGAHA